MGGGLRDLPLTLEQDGVNFKVSIVDKVAGALVL